MLEQLSHVSRRSIHNVALAYFTSPQRISDSIRDLCTADFAACHINISPLGAQTAVTDENGGSQPLHNAIGDHSLTWRWNRARHHDHSRRGADQLSGTNPTPAEGSNPTCYSFDVSIVLTALRVPAQVIALLQRELGQNGQFVMVDASDRVQEADRILDRNAGSLRTQYLQLGFA